MFDEIQKPFLEIYTRMLERKEKNQIRKEKLMAVGLLLSVKVFCLNEITIRITTETKIASLVTKFPIKTQTYIPQY